MQPPLDQIMHPKRDDFAPFGACHPVRVPDRRLATHRADFSNTTGKFLLPLMRRRLHDRFSDSRFAAPIRCLRIPAAWASEHQESNSDETRGKEGGYWCLLLVRQLW